ncbi:MAG TPA: hypothetical protein PKD09_22000 [Aggregatilinea sp.]|uniref:hypothetical protein n=1 Tax=Aggregatilinea sp. TaxID=2806333 RepID=UPI002C91E208|nr:hypothetical protein [Aggregatilinea sp.]HML24345.1 hypothetical protein [Aggregatilinea sp.]
MSGPMGIKFGFAVEVVQGDALTCPADVLAVKYARNSGGLDAQVFKLLGIPLEDRPLAGDSRLFSGKGVSATAQIVMIGVGNVKKLDYAGLRNLGRRFLHTLWQAGTPCAHLVTTVHGVRTGQSLDEIEVFRSLLLGFADAYDAGEYPSDLARITIMEQNEHRAQVLQAALDEFLVTLPAAAPLDLGEMPSPDDLFMPPPPSALPPEAPERGVGRYWKRRREESEAPAAPINAIPAPTPKPAARPPLRLIVGADSFKPEFRVAEATSTTPHVFVAMPFKDDYDDQFYLAIQPCIKDRGYLCERMDLDTFTGDIIDRMFERIRTARMVVALLDGGNPNVFLEVGYAWGVNTPTVLIAREGEPLPFDIKTQRVLMYEKIHKLKDMLTGELGTLLAD